MKKLYFCKQCKKEITRYSKLGYCGSCSHKILLSKPENNPMFGIHRFGKNSPNYKNGISIQEYFCKICNSKISYQTFIFGKKTCRECSSKLRLGEVHKVDCKCCFCKAKNGEYKGTNNPNYKENKEFKPYPLGWNKTFKEQIRYRDGYKCQECGVSEVDCNRKLHVHHIDYNKQNLDVNNLISLCHKCHAKTTVTNPEKNKYWIEHYIKI